ncbi:MAG: LytTR family transcriptional regulator [Robiginitomaculum sp.]|nr:LytTR family transcriptional regulator [Robiginitomaculum sp.]
MAHLGTGQHRVPLVSSVMEINRQTVHQQDIKLERQVWAWVALVGLFVAIVNVTSLEMEAAREGLPSIGIEPWIWGISSFIGLVVVVPFLLAWSRTISFTVENWGKALVQHLLLSMVFSALHVSIMVMVRKLAYPILLDEKYRFFGDIIRESLYEYRKDFGTYFLIIVTIYTARIMAEQARDLARAKMGAKTTGRVSLKLGTREIRIDAKDFLHAKSAGNYVDVYTNNVHYFVRSSLSALEQQFIAAGLDVRRAHRTRIINASAIHELVPIGSGDVSVVLSDGTTLRASRRYRDNLRQPALV